MRKLIILLLVIGLILWALPAVALAEDVSGTAGETSASADIDAGVAETSTTAAASDTTGQSIGIASGHGANNTGTGSAQTGGPDSIDNGAGSTTTVGEWETQGAASQANDGSVEGGASEEVSEIEVTAPTDLPLSNPDGLTEPFLLMADWSEGESRAEVTVREDSRFPYYSYAFSTHKLGGGKGAVSLYNGIILFETAYADVEVFGHSPTANASAEVLGLQLWDATNDSYTPPANVFHTTSNLEDILNNLNAVLAWSNIRILSLVDVYRAEGDDWAEASATAMATAVVDDDGNLVMAMVICDVYAYATPTSSETDGVEVAFGSPVEEAGKPKEEPKEEPITPQETPSEAPSGAPTQEGELPVTGANLILFGLLAAGLIGTGTTLRRKYAYTPRH